MTFNFLFLKDAFRALVGKGYQTLQSLLLDFCQWRPSEGLLYALLDMLVDGKFDIKTNPVIKVTLQNFIRNFVRQQVLFFTGIIFTFHKPCILLIGGSVVFKFNNCVFASYT